MAVTETGIGRTTTLRRTRGLIVIIAVAIVAAGGGFLASRWIKSPAELAAETDPPPASVITDPVELRVVSSGLVTRGTVGSLSTVDAVPQQAPAGVAESIITALPVRAGGRVKAGQVVVEISGQPVFFLPGKLPGYRDLEPGDSGPDVAQLQQGLRAAGYPDGDATGHFGTDTAAAVRKLYQDNGYQPIGQGTLPRSAVDYVDTATSTVVVEKAIVGQDAGKADIELASGDLVVLVDQTPAASDLVRQGASVALTAEILNQTAHGSITKIIPGQNGADGEAVITPDKPLPSGWAGQDVRVDIADASSKGKVLAVPVTAVTTGGDGRAQVTVVRGDQQLAVPVTVGATGDGYAQVTPEQPGAIKPGDQVLVGVQ